MLNAETELLIENWKMKIGNCHACWEAIRIFQFSFFNFVEPDSLQGRFDGAIEVGPERAAHRNLTDRRLKNVNRRQRSKRRKKALRFICSVTSVSSCSISLTLAGG